MEVDVAHYDRLQQGTAGRSCEYLHRCVNATIERDRLAWMHTEATRSIGGEHGRLLVPLKAAVMEVRKAARLVTRV